MKWLLFLDLDGTFWDHLDVSSTAPPFKKVSERTIEDSRHEKLTLNAGILDFVLWVRNSDGIISSCSWNKPSYALDALRTFGLEGKFDYQRISPEPRKDLLMIDLIKELHSRNVDIPQDRIFYIDDRDIHMEEIRKSLPGITFIHIWKEAAGFAEARKIISSKLGI